MQKVRVILSAISISSILFFFSCSNLVSPTGVYSPEGERTAFLSGATLTENFENGTKTAYAGASVSLGSGTWYLNDALIGTSSSDAKNGSKSVRVRNTGTVTMQFDKANGAGSVQIYHAIYGTDGSSTWELWISTNGGSTWSKVGSTVTTSSTTLTTATFTVNQSGNVRFEIRKVSGGTNRINIDDFSATDYGTQPPPGGDNDNMDLGNPSNATSDVNNANNYLMIKTQYDMSYNNSKHIPNWVSWHVYSPDLGSTPRQDNFRPDSTLPSGWYRVVATEYSGSGFDRGHHCPSGDRTATVADNSATFLMTNMMPQAPNNNEVTWENLEAYCRTLVSSGDELYIICGGYGQGGTGSSGYKTTVGNGVVVPAKTWKIIVVLPNGNNDISRISTSTRVIAVLMPNDQTCSNNPWGYYRVSVDSIESLTGYDFLSNVPANIQSVIESKVDNGPTS